MRKNFFICKPESQKELDDYFYLRWKILRKPLSMEIGSERDDKESEAYHVCVKNKLLKIVAVGRLHLVKKNDEDVIGQIRYMAVDNCFQRQGLGSMLLKELETKGKNNNMSSIVLNARDSSLKFYMINGYNIKEKSHLLYDKIQHWTMYKKI